MNTLIGLAVIKMSITKYLLAIVIAIVPIPNVEAFDENGEIFCLAKNIYFEAGNQPVAGKVAVSLVVLNRVEHHAYPDNVCDVIYQAQMRENWKGNLVPVRNRCQFSWFCDGKSDVPKDSKTWIKSVQIANNFMMNEHPDITEGAMWYHAYYINPYWAKHLNETVQINAHIFYK